MLIAKCCRILRIREVSDLSNMSQTKHQSALLPRVGRWVTELVLVFVGVYAAFWLNSYQLHQQDAKRRDQILASLEESVREEVESAEVERVAAERRATEFRRALEAGEMPPVRGFNLTTTYSASDYAALLQAGGVELLDIKTLSALHKAENISRAGVSEMEHYQRLSDEMVTPNLDQDISFFYDPATKKLRKRFAAYPNVLEATVVYFQKMEKAYQDLLAQVQAERRRR
jgi:hypothetical protein